MHIRFELHEMPVLQLMRMRRKTCFWKLKSRSKREPGGQAIRLEIEAAADRRLLKILCRELSVRKEDVFEIDGPLDLTFLMKVYGLEGFDELRAPKYTPAPVPEFDGTDNIFV